MLLQWLDVAKGQRRSATLVSQGEAYAISLQQPLLAVLVSAELPLPSASLKCTLLSRIFSSRPALVVYVVSVFF